MEQITFFNVCGIVASVCMILGYLPQAIETIRTRNTDGIALPTFLMMAIGPLPLCCRVCYISQISCGPCS